MTPVEIDHRVFRPLLLRAMLLPGLVLLLLTAGLLWQIGRILLLDRWVDHTDQVIAAANKAQQLMTDRETGLRGYLITGNPVFLDPYNVANDQLPAALATLDNLISDNPSQTEREKAIRAAEEEL